jgi:hypothetical protein
MVACEWIHPDRLKFIPKAKLKQFDLEGISSKNQLNHYRVEREKGECIICSATPNE